MTPVKTTYQPKSWHELNYRDKVTYSLTWALTTFGVILIGTGMVCPPLGEIDPSVISTFGLILTWCGVALGMKYYISGSIANVKDKVDEQIKERLATYHKENHETNAD